MLNKAQLENNFVLRSLISYSDIKSKKTTHFLILQEMSTDKLYTVNKFNATVQDSYKNYLQAKITGKQTPGFVEEEIKRHLLSKVSETLN